MEELKFVIDLFRFVLEKWQKKMREIEGKFMVMKNRGEEKKLAERSGDFEV